MTGAEFDGLYRAQHRRLFGAAWQLTGNVADAEDAVQETFLRALRSADAYEERGRVGAWLTRILVNVVRERGRRASYYRWRIEPELITRAGEGQDPEPSPESRVLSVEAVARALRGLQELPDAFREVLVLRQFGEHSTADVAGILGIPEATVRTRLKRARDLLLRQCEPTGTDGRRSG
jgi:RNA polymerase sigma-70 factor (ECF subfamily)